MTTETEEHLPDDTLQRFFDGEATEGEANDLQAQLETELELARLERLERLGGLLRDHADTLGADIDSNALFDGIQAGIDKAKSEGPRLRLIQGQRRQRAGVAVALAVAIAAAVALVFYLKPPADDNLAEAHPFDTTQEVIVHDLHPVEVHPPGGSEVEDVDFGGNTGTIFQVPGEHGQPLAVVWIDEEAHP